MISKKKLNKLMNATIREFRDERRALMRERVRSKPEADLERDIEASEDDAQAEESWEDVCLLTIEAIKMNTLKAMLKSGDGAQARHTTGGQGLNASEEQSVSDAPSEPTHAEPTHAEPDVRRPTTADTLSRFRALMERQAKRFDRTLLTHVCEAFPSHPSVEALQESWDGCCPGVTVLQVGAGIPTEPSPQEASEANHPERVTLGDSKLEWLSGVGWVDSLTGKRIDD
jgi:hypothetical protein